MKSAVRKLLVGNATWNVAGIVVAILGGFITAPMIIHHLGTNRYAIWVLIGSLDGYFGLMDLGVRGSVGRHIALHRSTGDHAALRSTYRSAIAIQLCVAALAAVAGAIAMVLFFHIFRIPADQAFATRVSFVVMTIGIVIEFPMSVFDAALWGLNRFDVLNAIDIPSVIAHTALTLVFIARGNGLIALAVINVAVTTGVHFCKAIVLFVIEPMFRDLRPHVQLVAAHDLFSWGFWYFVLSLFRIVAREAGVVIVGSVIALAIVTPLSIASRLIAYASEMLVAAADVITPVATGLHATGDRSRQQQLLLTGGMHCMALAIFSGAAILFLGGPFISLWIGVQGAPVRGLLAVLVIGSLLPMSQRPAYAIILAKGKHKTLAQLAIIENAIGIPAALLAAKPFGVIGVCICLGAAAFLNRGVCLFVFGCSLTSVPISRCFVRTVLLPMATLCIPVAALGTTVAIASPRTWMQFLFESIAFTLACLAAWNASTVLAPLLRKIAPNASTDSIWSPTTTAATD